MEMDELISGARRLSKPFRITDGTGFHLRERLENSEKHWKFSPSDTKERAFWKQYMAAYEDTIRHTATKHAPWYVVPADNKWFTGVVVAAAVINTSAGLDLRHPKVDEARLRELAAARRALRAGK